MQGGFLKDKDFKDQHITETEEFLSISAFFKLMVDYNSKKTLLILLIYESQML